MPRPLFALLLLAPLALAADEPKKVEGEKENNTRGYLAWAKFKPGTAVTLRMVHTLDGETRARSMTAKLLEVKEKDDTLVFEVGGTKPVGEKEEVVKAVKVEVKKGESGPWSLPTFDLKTGKPEDTVEEGKEKVKVGGTEYDCRVYTTKDKSSGREMTVWLCDDFPGLLVKAQVKDGKITTATTSSDVTVKK